MGVNRTDCSSLLIRLKDQKVKSITFYNHPEATLYPPLDLPPKEALLKDFIWRANEQPKSVNELFIKNKLLLFTFQKKEANFPFD